MKVSYTEFGISKFAETFPALSGAAGISPWNAEDLDTWAAESDRSPNELHSAKYVLHLWNPDATWLCGGFDVSAATKAWDVEHRAAFLRLSGMGMFQDKN